MVKQIGSNITSTLGPTGDSAVLGAFPMGTEKGKINLSLKMRQQEAFQLNGDIITHITG